MTILAALLWIVLVLAALSLGLAALRYALFLVSNARAGSLARIRKDLGGLGLPLLAACWSASWSMTAALALLPLALLPESEPEPGSRPVILVHGLYHNRAAWAVFRRRLRRRGRARIFTCQYNSWTMGFEDAVAELMRTLDRVLGPNPERKAVLIGHSLGGLIVRAAAADPRYRDRIAGMVTLGSPHQGAALAAVGVGSMARSLTPDGAATRRMADIEDAPCPRLALYTLTDDMVFPLAMLLPAQPGWETRTCPGESHVSLLFSPRVFENALNFLEKHGAFDAPTGADEADETNEADAAETGRNRPEVPESWP